MTQMSTYMMVWPFGQEEICMYILMQTDAQRPIDVYRDQLVFRIVILGRLHLEDLFTPKSFATVRTLLVLFALTVQPASDAFASSWREDMVRYAKAELAMAMNGKGSQL